MENKFKDSFDYLVAFLAVLVGLGVFKDFAEQHYLLIFGFNISYFQLTLPFIGIMLLAVYLGALAMLSKNIPFKFFPLTRLLENLSYFFAAFGLLYPLIVLVTAGLSIIANLLPKNVDYKEYYLLVSTAASFIQAVAVIIIAKRYATSKQQDKYDVTLRELRARVQTEKTPINTSTITPYEIVMLYHQFVSLSKALLKLKGYGVAGENITLLGQSLLAQKVLDKKDLKQVNKVRLIRNKIVHPSKPVDKKDLTEARKHLEALISKIKQVILTLEEK